MKIEPTTVVTVRQRLTNFISEAQYWGKIFTRAHMQCYAHLNGIEDRTFRQVAVSINEEAAGVYLVGRTGAGEPEQNFSACEKEAITLACQHQQLVVLVNEFGGIANTIGMLTELHKHGIIGAAP